jgi:UDP-N-acetylglucosamine diphosphorylase/glucosamine-1-phosphate N-acetyltransferase
MVAGTMLIRERWTSLLGADDARFLAGPRHADFDEPGTHLATETIPAGSIIVNARYAPVLSVNMARAERTAATCSVWYGGTQLAAVRLQQAIDASAFADGSLTLNELHAGTGVIGTIDGWWLEEVWDFVRFLPEQLASDIPRLIERHRLPVGAPTHAVVLGDHAVAVLGNPGEAPPVIEPTVVFDATAGPIVVGRGSHLRAFTRLTGPCYIGRGTQILGGDITGCSIGDVCKVRGEISNTTILGYSNKGHDGFIGHSYLGMWVNLGAGTITSNLKNTYGPVSLWTPTGIRATDLTFLGTLFGDHVKTGIGLRLTTGTVVGAGSNIYGPMPPKVVAPFSWGEAPAYTTYRADKFVETAATAMARRHVELSDRARQHLTAAHAARWTAGDENLGDRS